MIASAAAAEFIPDDAVVLVQLAAAAMGDLSSGALLPSGWSPLATLPSDAPPRPSRTRRPQGFYAFGTLPSAPDTSVVVLAVGLPWITGLNALIDGIMLIDDITNIGIPFDTLYQGLRGAVWANVKRGEGYPLYVVGMGVGGALAQLAAYDLRAGNTGPSKEKPPEKQPSCFTFSSPPPGGQAFAAKYAGVVTTSYTAGLAKPGIPVDLFPTAPDGYVRAGAAQTISAAIPEPFDDPWVERSPNMYVANLGGAPVYPPTIPGALTPIPKGFDPLLAHSLARLSTVPYQLAQHPNLGQPTTFDQWTLEAVIQSAGSPLAAIYTTQSQVAVAFRGVFTWAETGGVLQLSTVKNAGFIAKDNAFVHEGALGLYTGSVTSDPAGTPFRDALRTALAPLAQGRTLYFTGHDLGGALAVLTAVDIATNASSLGNPSVYTFGSCPVGDDGFATIVGATLPDRVFMIARPGDFMPTAMLSGAYSRPGVGTAIALNGVPPNEEPSLHSLTGYIALLNPR